MKKILIKIQNNNLVFKEKKKLTTEYKNLLNTNFISCDELLFSDEYINSNLKIVANFINEIIKEKQIDTIIIESNSIEDIILNVLKYIQNVSNLILKDNCPLSFTSCEKIIKSSIKSLNCFTIQPFMLEILDKNKIIVESRNEILFSSNFMKQNNLNIYSSLYYKMTLHLNFPLSNEDEEDFKTFCKINKYLKTIHVNKVTKSDLELIVEVLRKKGKKNIKIIIHEDINNEETIEYLRNFQKKYSKRYKIYFRIAYSKKYLQDNLLKQTNINILKYCGVIIIFIVLVSFAYVFYDNYISMRKDKELQDKLKKVIDVNKKDSLEDINKDLPDNKKIKEDKYAKILNSDLASLLSVNPDVVGWLTVNGTKINYPILQATDNEYYLKHDIYSKKDSNGWIFADYRNNRFDLNDNLILYGHNRYSNGVMFGTLGNVLKSSWYKKSENHTLTYQALYGTYHYKVFSVYTIEKTTDYLLTQFFDDQTRLDFYSMLKARSIYDFGVELKGSDKIITLSTCKDDNDRIVLHAVLVKD